MGETPPLYFLKKDEYEAYPMLKILVNKTGTPQIIKDECDIFDSQDLEFFSFDDKCHSCEFYPYCDMYLKIKPIESKLQGIYISGVLSFPQFTPQDLESQILVNTGIWIPIVYEKTNT
ncbi:hypothetical protein [Vibrio harveyi]|uniref:hypothetical protein n=1 Tax=Vibrio harveyi TaxID=669 RepID=UPI0018F24347|nr:hypothetical protein [Vibrio harveyi]